jgi:uncharacterized membrane protein YhaH (DUF805 family)
VLDLEPTGRRRLPFWLWFVLWILVLTVVATLGDALSEHFGWSSWVENGIPGGTVGLFAAFGGPRIAEAKRAARKRRAARRK